MVKINESLAEEIGIHIGDGSMNVYSGAYCYTIACHKSDDRQYMDEFIIPLIKNIYNLNPKPRNWSRGTYGFRVCSKKMLLFKQNLGLPLGKKYNIKIPEKILEDINLSKACLRGIFDTDGCLYLEKKYGKIYPRIQISTTSKALFEQLKKLFGKLGLTYSSWSRKANINWEETNIICTRGFKNLDIWIREVNSNNSKHLKKIETLRKENYIN